MVAGGGWTRAPRMNAAFLCKPTRIHHTHPQGAGQPAWILESGVLPTFCTYHTGAKNPLECWAGRCYLMLGASSRQSERGRRSCGVSAPINRGWRSRTCTASRRRACWAKRCTTWTGSGPSSWRFLDNGTWPLDSNPVENAIRPFVVGRRRWLFADTVGGANGSANLYSLIETAKGNNVEPVGTSSPCSRSCRCRKRPTTTKPCCHGDSCSDQAGKSAICLSAGHSLLRSTS